MSSDNQHSCKINPSNYPNLADYKIGIVVSEWNDKITEGLFQGAFDTFIDCGVQKENIVRWNVPGSFELIYGCKKMQQRATIASRRIPCDCRLH